MLYIQNMPEGPEVYWTAAEMRRFRGQTITEVQQVPDTGTNKTVRGVIALVALIGAVITEVASYGKKVIFILDNGLYMFVSLGMSGRLSYTPGNYNKVSFFTDTSEFYFGQPRPIGWIEVVSDMWGHIRAHMGPDILDAAIRGEWITREEWIRIFSGKAQNWQVSSMLLDQGLIAGIGNYLKSEILHYAGVHPFRIVSTLTAEEMESIRVAAHNVIYAAWARGGLTIESYITPSGFTGDYAPAVYGRRPSNDKVMYQDGCEICWGKDEDKRGTFWLNDGRELKL